MEKDFCIRDKGRRIVIIGNGISGITCARQLRKNDADARIQVISSESEHFFSRTALMYIYMGHMKYEHTKPYEDHFWQKNRIELLFDRVEHIDFETKALQLKNGGGISYDILVLALGSKVNRFGWPGQDLEGVQGLYSKQDVELMETNTRGIRRGVIVGGGLIGIEMAEMLRSRNIDVTFLVRENSFWNMVLPPEESDMINRHIREHHVDLRLSTQLKEIHDNGSGHVNAVTTDSGETIQCEFVGLTAGVSPNIDFLKGLPIETNRGVLVDACFATSIPHVFAIGDCAEFRQAPGAYRRTVEQVWYTGRMHGETLAYNLTHAPVPYSPGPWFNSAKFFDIEYQTYGHVPAALAEEFDSFYWEHPGGKICFRAVYHRADHSLAGINNFGMRLRHGFFDRALKERWTVENVMYHLEKAHFDPEFYRRHHAAIVQAFNRHTGQSLSGKKQKRSKPIRSRSTGRIPG